MKPLDPFDDIAKAEEEFIEILIKKGLCQQDIEALLCLGLDKIDLAEDSLVDKIEEALESPETKIEEIKRKMGYSEPKEP